jgi:hypothetical protein
MNIPPLEWKTLEHSHTEKTTDWYWALGIISLSVAVISIIVHNPLFAAFIIIASITLGIFASQKPNEIEVRIEPKGVTIGRFHFAFRDLKSFWIEHEHTPTLLLRPKKNLSPLQVVFINDVSSDQVREYLLAFLKEEEVHEPIGQKVLEYFGF